MSWTVSCCGRAIIWSQVQLRASPNSEVTVNVQSSAAACGAGPADSRGNDSVGYCPGGSRSARERARPRKPGEKEFTASSPEPKCRPISPATYGSALSVGGLEPVDHSAGHDPGDPRCAR